MKTIIKLAPGNIGWFDPLTSIHLTLAKTEAIISPGMNTTNIKIGLSEGKLILKQGTLETSRQISYESITKIKTEKENIVSTKTEASKETTANKKTKTTRAKKKKTTK